MAEEIKGARMVGAMRRIGNKWEKDGLCRIYFNDLHSLYGLRLDYYKSGNIAGAWLNGEHISNNRADKLVERLRRGKFWWDYDDREFHSQGLEDDDRERIIAGLWERIAVVSDELDAEMAEAHRQAGDCD